MSATPPIPMQWTGDGFVPAGPYWAKKADQHFVVGQVYPLEVREERSSASHRHYFAAIAEAWENLPLETLERWPTPEHLRRWALIQCGYADQRAIVCDTAADARRVAAFIQPMDDFAVVAVSDAVVTVYTAKSQSIRAMDKRTFQESKDKVLEYVASLIGSTAGALAAHTSEAA